MATKSESHNNVSKKKTNEEEEGGQTHRQTVPK